MTELERARELIEKLASQVSTSQPGELWEMERPLALAMLRAKLEEAEWWDERRKLMPGRDVLLDDRPWRISAWRRELKELEGGG